MQKGRLAGMNIITQNQKSYLFACLYNFHFKNKPKIVYFYNYVKKCMCG